MAEVLKTQKNMHTPFIRIIFLHLSNTQKLRSNGLAAVLPWRQKSLQAGKHVGPEDWTNLCSHLDDLNFFEF